MATEAPGAEHAASDRVAKGGVLRSGVPFVVALWAAEVLLARVSGEPQAVVDPLESLVGLALLGLAPAVAFGFLPVGRLRTVALALCAAAPLTVVVFGIALPVVVSSAKVGAAAGLGIALVLAAWRTVVGLRGGGAFPSPLATVAVVGGVAIGVWLLNNDSLPRPSILLPLVALWAGVGWAARRVALAPVVVVVCLVVAWLPRPTIRPEWTNEAPPAAGPDIVFLLVDTLRADAGEQMPSYMRIAKEGVAFRNAQAAAPWTSPSMGTLFTGLRPPEHGALRMARMGAGKLLPGVETLAEILFAAGYDTAGVVTSDAAGPRRGFGRGVDVLVEGDLEWALPRARNSRRARPFLARAASLAGLQGRPDSIDDGVLSGYARQVIEGRRQDRPLFLWVHYLDPHLPYRHADSSSLEGRRAIQLDNGDANIFGTDPFWSSETGLEAIRTVYDWEVQRTDAALTAILDALGPVPERGRILVMTSDHGEEFLEHGGMLHGHAFHQEVIRVPLVIAGLPGRAAGSEELGVVGHIDVMPTLLAAAGLSYERLVGQDLAGPIESRIYVSENLSTLPSDERIAAREGDWKLIRGPGDRVRLYHLGDDPGELTNVAAQHPDVVERLTGALTVEAAEPIPVELSEEDHRMLEALGYVEE